MKLELFIKGVSRPGTWLALTEVTDYSTGSAFELVQKIIDPRYAGSATVLDSYPAPHSPDAKLSNDGLRQERMGLVLLAKPCRFAESVCQSGKCLADPGVGWQMVGKPISATIIE